MKKRILSILLCLSMVVCMLPTTAFAAGTGAIQLVDSTSNPTGSISGYTASGYHYVYYGEWNSAPIKWRVLDDQTNTGETGLFLLSEDLLGTGTFGDVYFDNTFPYSNAWQGSNAQGWCKDFAGESGASEIVSDAFTDDELAAILATVKNDSDFTSSTNNVPFASATDILNGDKVFFLSAEEAENSDYGFTDESSRTANYNGSADLWWLRSPFAGNGNDRRAGIVDYDGIVFDYDVSEDWAARPAFNLNLNSVLFTSAAAGGKTSGTAGADALNPVSTTAPTEWKLTLDDSANRASFTVSTTNVTALAGDSVNITYSGANSGTNEYLSAMIVDSTGNVLYYGRMKNIAVSADASGTQSITIPSGLAAGSYTLKIFSEQYNGDEKTDYASAMKDVTLTVTEPVSAPTNLSWNGTGTATWNASANASSYTVQLYKDGTAYGTPKTVNTGTSYDFASDITESGSYTFTVIAKGDSVNFADSVQSEQSAEYSYTKPAAAADNSVNVTDSAQSAENDYTKPETTSPQTGNSSTAGLWIALLALSASGLAVLCISKKNKRTN
ncbi:MAG: DUF6273 domain-containing protein [Eubacteriaceae bacterium]|jgi:hypothetical protein